MNTLIADSIRSRKVLSLSYGGYARLVEPHCYGANKDGDELLRCYQIGGGHQNKAGKPHTWDLLTVAMIRNLTVTGESFSAPRPGYKKGDKAIATIYAEL